MGSCSAYSPLPQEQFIQRAKKNGDKCAGPFIFSLVGTDGKQSFNCSGSTLSFDICHSVSENRFYFYGMDYETIERSIVEKTTKITNSEDNYTQELIYNGRVGDSLKFIYRETVGNNLRPMLTQEIQYDLSKSNRIAFKNLLLDIIEVNNQSITYKLISSF
jgi:hypothetical protein|tara:strand:+ start:324 stop:806 length:483 start_codon:yes stop_codon:yes gene_type:complete